MKARKLTPEDLRWVGYDSDIHFNRGDLASLKQELYKRKYAKDGRPQLSLQELMQIDDLIERLKEHPIALQEEEAAKRVEADAQEKAAQFKEQESREKHDKSVLDKLAPIDKEIADLTTKFKADTSGREDPLSHVDESLAYENKLKELNKKKNSIKSEGEKEWLAELSKNQGAKRKSNENERKLKEHLGTPIDSNAEYFFKEKPRWFNEAMQQNFANAWNTLNPDKPFPKSPYPTFAEPNELQSLLKHLAPEVIKNPAYRKAFQSSRDSITSAANTNPWSKDTDTGRSAIDEFRNPYEEDVIDNIYSDAADQFNKKIMPKINANFISRGAFNSGARGAFAQQALKDINKDAMKTANDFRFKNNQAAIENERQHRAGKVQHSQSLNEITKQQQLNDILGLETLRGVGQQDYNREQNILDRRNAEFREEQNWPLFQQQRIHEMLNEMPISEYGSHYAPKQAGSSMASDAGNTIGALYMNNLAGGRQQGFAAGGQVTPGFDDDYVEKLQAAIGHMSQPSGNPLYSAMARMFAGAAASNNPNPFKALAQQTPAGLDAMQAHKDREANKQIQVLNIMKGISDSKFRMHQMAMKKEEFEFNKKMELANLDLKERELAQRGQNGEPQLPTAILKEIQKAQDAALESTNVEEEGLHMKEAFDTLDNSTNALMKPGGRYSKVAASNIPILSPLLKSFYPKDAQAALETIEKGRSNLAGKLNVASGAPSIPNLQNFLDTIPGLGYSKEARDPVVNTIIGGAKKAQAWDSFLRNYIATHGTNVGAGEAFNSQYKSASDGKEKPLKYTREEAIAEMKANGWTLEDVERIAKEGE